jgi:hypothetical protein
MHGTLSSSIAVWRDIVTFNVYSNALTGSVPAAVAIGWTKILDFQVAVNQQLSGVLPALPFADMKTCLLAGPPTHTPLNAFDCAWPAGVVGKCMKGDGTYQVPITAADCKTTCTGASTKLAQPQCNAWATFFDALGGDGWKVTDPDSPKHNEPVCRDTRTDPCSCYNWVDNTSICNDNRTAVTSM